LYFIKYSPYLETFQIKFIELNEVLPASQKDLRCMNSVEFSHVQNSPVQVVVFWFMTPRTDVVGYQS